MRPVVGIIGILLILFGIGVLGIKDLAIPKQEKVAQIGDLQVTADTEKTVYFPQL